MKKSLVATAIIMVTLVMGFTSCSKDYSKLIIGSWTNTEGSYLMAEEGKLDIPANSYAYTFNSDNTLFMGIESEIRCNYYIDGDVLTIENQPKINIVKLTSKLLILEINNEYTYHMEFQKVK